MLVCKICKSESSPNAIRLGVCWRCIEAESIIEGGLDMYDKGLNGDNTPAETSMDKVRLLIARGCIRKV